MKDSFKRMFNLNADQADIFEIDKRISDGAVVRGSNLYILIFAILIASIGLNMDSTAVVIGAMLISPLMGVIMNFAFGIASQDFIRARSSVWNLIVQVGVSILTSTIYFKLSPMNTFSGELMARTMPTFWDVLIAFFGGFSAIIALTRKNSVSNVIPGAAIATALMPPLCTVGYCIAQAEWLRALGALYLFTINAVFICISGMTGLYIMKIVDIKKIVSNKRQRRFFAITIMLVILPSTVLAWYSVEQDRIDRNYKSFVNTEFAAYETTDVVKSELSLSDKSIEVFLMGTVLEDEDIKNVEKKLPQYDLQGYELHVVQASANGSFSKEEFNDMINEHAVSNKISLEEAKQNKKMLDVITSARELQQSVSEEILMLYPEVISAGFTETVDNDKKTEFTLLLNVKEKLADDKKESLSRWLDGKFKKPVKIIQNVIVVEEDN